MECPSLGARFPPQCVIFKFNIAKTEHYSDFAVMPCLLFYFSPLLDNSKLLSCCLGFFKNLFGGCLFVGTMKMLFTSDN